LKVTIRIAASFPLEQAGILFLWSSLFSRIFLKLFILQIVVQAHEFLESRGAAGKIILDIDPAADVSGFVVDIY
jgi:hypothetical protein